MGADERLLPSWEGPGVGRFKESPLSFFRMHRDHEPGLARSAGFPACGFGRLSSRPSLVHRTGKYGKPAGWKARPTLRFMESLLSIFRMHWDHELVRGGTPLVWSPAFRRFGPAKAGTPNGRLMERRLGRKTEKPAQDRLTRAPSIHLRADCSSRGIASSVKSVSS